MTFDEFYLAVTNHQPFAWQSRLARECLESDPGRIAMPDVCKLPTASGKTAVILIGLYAMAVRPEAHRRIAYVVDRRIVTDAGYDMILDLKKRLDARHPALTEWAEMLRKTCRLAPTDSLLEVHLLRGGLGEPLAKLKSPLTPTVMISTVDQLGSRLLFRGYGASARSWPIAAGLLAYDTLWILDEAHISTAFSQTLTSVRDIVAGGPIPRPMSVVELTATPRDSSKHIFSLGVPDDRIRPRLEASKQTTIEVIEDDKAFTDAVTRSIDRELAAGRKRIGVIVNRIRLARDIFGQMRKKHKKANVVLLIGPIRNYDRRHLYERPEIRSLFAKAPAPDVPTIAVCTQTVEVGADFDFDALVTQSAPIDVLKQRFGRLDRLGSVGTTRGTIVHIKSAEPDRIYGTAVNATISFLEPYANAGTLDFGVLAFDGISAKETPAMRATVKEAEPLVAPHVERLAQTWTVPYDSPDIAAFLHGEPTGGEVTICWRDLLKEGAEGSWGDHVQAALPASNEVLSIPLYAARAWLRKKKVDEADVSLPTDMNADEQYPDDRASADIDRSLYRISADSSTTRRDGAQVGEVVRRASALREGDSLVVPSSYGGCDDFGWDPAAGKDRVSDLSELAYFKDRRARLALEMPQVDDEDERDDALRAALLDIINGEDAERAEIAAVIDKHFSDVSSVEVGDIVWLTWRGRASDEDRVDMTSLIDGPDITLEAHSAHVRDRARLFAQECSLPKHLVDIIAAAGWRHDLGKADIPFQIMLGNGTIAETPLAKGRRGRIAPERRLSTVARNFRHEAVSVTMLDDLGVFADPALTRHLVGTHHGFGRPWFPATKDDSRDVSVQLEGVMFSGTSVADLGRIESGWVEQFVDLSERYTAWGLAYVEGLLRLADHRCSEDEEQGRYDG
jgi:CRISPR-associated endonuclease/helicase Cas3